MFERFARFCRGPLEHRGDAEDVSASAINAERTAATIPSSDARQAADTNPALDAVLTPVESPETGQRGTEPTVPPAPEQPVPLATIQGGRKVRVGVVLPARRSFGTLSLPTPRVPKRAILAAGVCAGLAAPAITRHLAARALIAALGPARSTAMEAATIEIIRVSFTSPKTGQAAAAVSKLLEQIRR